LPLIFAAAFLDSFRFRGHYAAASAAISPLFSHAFLEFQMFSFEDDTLAFMSA